MIKPYVNAPATRQRNIPTSLATVLTLAACFWGSYLTARLKKDEQLRRICHIKYFNFITGFDLWLGVTEHYLARAYDSFIAFDSVESSWRIRRGWLSEWRERFRMREQIDRK